MNSYYPISDAMVEKAKKMHSHIRKRLRYGFDYESQRWTGRLGEIFFDQYLSDRGIEHEWLNKEIQRNPDFKIGSQNWELKTTNRNRPVGGTSGVSVNAERVHPSTHVYVWLCYEYPKQRLWILGGATHDYFLDNAKLYKEGETVPNGNFKVMGTSGIYDIAIERLRPIEELLKEIRVE